MPEPIYFDRDLSWLQFNHRVLQEAADRTNPLYERLKFLAIYSSNLDEFFRVRVSSLRSLRKIKDLPDLMDIEPKKALKKIKEIVHTQQEEFGRVFTQEIIPALKQHRIALLKESEFSPEQMVFAQNWFDRVLVDKVTPYWLNQGDDFWLENRALYLVLEFKDSDDVALLSIPQDVKRFVELPEHDALHAVAFIDDIMRSNVAKIFPDKVVKGIFAIKISRDAELYLGDEFSGDLISRLEERVKERRKGLPTRFLYDSSMPPALLKRLRKQLKISKYDLIPGGRYHNFHDFFSFPDPTNNPDLKDKPLPPQHHSDLHGSKSIIPVIEKKDILLHFPYQSYSYIPTLIREAADDPDVKAIKITLYRVAGKSEVATALLEALGKGKKVFAFIEAKARFDEESNLFWGRQLEQAGASIKYSFPAIKVHSKLMFIERDPSNNKRHLCYLGTGNFNEKTAKLYTDHALLTSSSKLTNEVARVFEMLEGRILAPQCKHLLVSPFTTRPGFMELIDQEIQNARMGKVGSMTLKMNSLEDKRMINKLYDASLAGVRIQLIVRGICCLIPGVPGLSENIEIISIVDRFLEHGRVYIFHNGGAPRTFLASADWMRRNLDRRVEVVFPIYDPELQKELKTIIDTQLSDNVKARVIDQTQSNELRHGEPTQTRFRAQEVIYTLLGNS